MGVTRGSMSYEALRRRLAGIREPRLRLALVRDRLAHADLPSVVGTLALALAPAGPHDPLRGEVARLMLHALTSPSVPAPRRSAIAEFAQRQGLELAAHFVLPRPDDVPNEKNVALPYKGDRPLTLGARKSLARGADRNLLARVLRDPHPSVIEVLLESPKLTTRDIVRLAARAPIAPESLLHIWKHLAIRPMPEVQLALVYNPFMPAGQAVPMVATLLAPALGEVARTPSLRPAIREGARMLQRRNSYAPV